MLHATIRNGDIQVAVVVEVDEITAESRVRQIDPRQAGCRCSVVKQARRSRRIECVRFRTQAFLARLNSNSKHGVQLVID